METSYGKQAERALERPKRSKNEAKKRSSAVWDQENSQVRILSPRPEKGLAMQVLFQLYSPSASHIATQLYSAYAE